MKWLSDNPIKYQSEDKLNFENSVNILKKIIDEVTHLLPSELMESG